MDGDDFVNLMVGIRSRHINLHAAAENALSRINGLPNSTIPDSYLLQAYWRVIEAVEAEGKYRDQLGQELAYHNRIHVSETLTALSYFFLIDR